LLALIFAQWKFGTLACPELSRSGHGTQRPNSGQSRKIRDGWQPYCGPIAVWCIRRSFCELIYSHPDHFRHRPTLIQSNECQWIWHFFQEKMSNSITFWHFLEISWQLFVQISSKIANFVFLSKMLNYPRFRSFFVQTNFSRPKW